MMIIVKVIKEGTIEEIQQKALEKFAVETQKVIYEETRKVFKSAGSFHPDRKIAREYARSNADSDLGRNFISQIGSQFENETIEISHDWSVEGF